MLTSVLKGRSLPMIAIVAVVMGTAALTIHDPYVQLILGTIPIWAALALSWNLFSGYTGLVSFGHATFFGLGAYAVALLGIFLGVPAWVGLVAAAGVGAVAALIIGSVTFRLRGHYFALAMLAYPALFIFVFDWMGWQELSFPNRRDEPSRYLQFADHRWPTFIAVGVMIAMMLITHWVERSRFGLAMLAIKQNEVAAEAAGIDTFRVKMIAFVASGALGALVGGLQALVLQVVTPHGVLGVVISAQALILTLFGGVGTLWGPVIGAVTLVPLTEMLRAQLGHILPGIQGVIYGLVIMLVVLLAPEGVYWKVRDMLAGRRKGAAAPQASPTVPVPAGPAHGPAHGPVHASPAARTVARPAGTEPILEVRGLSKFFGGLKAVQDVSFDVRRGEILGVIGPNGAGKTTLFNVLNGILPPTAGTVTLAGVAVRALPPNRLNHRGLGRTFQVARPFARMSVLHNAVVGAIAGSHSGADALARARAALVTVGLADKADAAVSELTNLELRLMELARALAGQPQLLLLDETLAGLGAREVDAMVQVIQRLPAAGHTVVIIEHTMHAMTRMANRFIVLDHGQVIAEGDPATVMAHPDVIDAYLGKKWAAQHRGSVPAQQKTEEAGDVAA